MPVSIYATTPQSDTGPQSGLTTSEHARLRKIPRQADTSKGEPAGRFAEVTGSCAQDLRL